MPLLRAFKNLKGTFGAIKEPLRTPENFMDAWGKVQTCEQLMSLGHFYVTASGFACM
jgi:hypothetical protein